MKRTWDAVYVRGTLPPGYRPDVAGACWVRRVGAWTELELPRAQSGSTTAHELSTYVDSPVIWVTYSANFHVLAVEHVERGKSQRIVVYVRGTWQRVHGSPQLWERSLFSEERLQAARAAVNPDEHAVVEAAFARNELVEGAELPRPDVRDVPRRVIDVNAATWDEAHAQSPTSRIRGRRRTWITNVIIAVSIAGLAWLVAFAAQ